MSSSKERERLKKIKSGVFSRGLALAKVSVSAGARVATHTVSTLFASEAEKTDRLKEMLISQLSALTRELGQLKGSLMKVGQLLSMYGEHFLPPEANALLKSLQSQSPPLEWNQIEKVLKRQLVPEKLALLEIDPDPIGSASLGQVHYARLKLDGTELAMKIQYPGVDQAIEGDLKALQSVLSISKIIPKGPKYDELFKEVRAMLHQEVDYARELKLTDEFHNYLVNDARYVVPKTYPELSTRRVLTTSYEEGIPVDSPEILNLSLERRNAIGSAILELYFRELFDFGAVQTDPHFGNYRIRLGKNGQPDQLVLFDFGAVRKFSKSFLQSYLSLVKGSYLRDERLIIQAAMELGFVFPEDSDQLKKVFTELCCLIGEPFQLPTTANVPSEFYGPTGAYLWGKSDLPKRAAKKGAELAFSFKLRTPPREILFLDRKMGGIFIFLSVLKAEFLAGKVLEQFISSKP